LVPVAAVAALSAGSAGAQTWTGTTSSDWTIGTNWSGGTAPTGASAVIIATTSPNPTVLGVGGAATGATANFVIGTVGNSGDLTIQNGSTLTTNGGTHRIAQGTGSTATVAVTGTGSQWNISGSQMIVGLSGTGTLSIRNAGLVIAQEGLRLGNNSNGSGTLNVSSGGTLETTALSMGIGTAQANFDNATLRARTSSVSSFVTGFSAGTLNIAAGGLTLDMAGFTVGTDATSGFSGAGNLTVIGSGTLNLGASNTHTGQTVIQAGTLALTGAGSLAASSRVVATSTFDISGITATGTNIRSLAGSGTVNLGTKTLALTNANDTFAGAINGAGGLTVAGGTLTLSGTSGYTGATTVNGGGLVVNGTLASGVTVNGGFLGGTGTIAALTVNGGGTLAPGNSIGTVTVTGNYVHNAGGIYQVEINAAGQSDRTNVTGTATLNGGTVQMTGASGNYAATTTYTIVNATGGVTGTYAGASTNMAFLTPTLSYDANNVYLNVRASFTDGGTTSNEREIGRVLDEAAPTATGDLNAILGVLLGLDKVLGPMALTTISGQPYASFGTVNVQSSRLFMNAVGQQQALARGPAAASSRVALAEACATACDTAEPARWASWMSGMGTTGSVGGSANSATLSFTMGGVAVGLDYRLDPRFLVGLAVGYSSGRQCVGGFQGTGSADNYDVSLYASFGQGAFYADALAGYAYADNQLQRIISIPGMASRIASGRTGANQFLGQVEAGYKVGLYAPAEASLTPFARLQTVAISQGAFGESGATALNLNVRSQNTTSIRSLLGVDLGARIPLSGQRVLDTTVRLGWAHEFAQTTRPMTAAFAGAPTLPFTIYGAEPQRDAAVIGLGFNTAVADAAAVYLRYDGEISGRDDAHLLSAGLRITW
jgi:outer membrane autotransporter protein